MFQRILILEFGNNKGLWALENLRKIGYRFIAPNIIMTLAAIALTYEQFYEPSKMILIVLGSNIVWTALIQFSTQRGVFRNLENEPIIKFIPTKTTQFIWIRLTLFFAKFYYPILLFNIVFISFFVAMNQIVALIILIIASILFIYIQINASIIIRYIANTVRPIYLHIMQISLFILAIICIGTYQWMATFYIMESLDAYFAGATHDPFQLSVVYLAIATIGIILLAISISIITKRMNLLTIIHNRELNLKIDTSTLEKWHYTLYKYRLTKIQKLIFNKDIKYIFRHSKVLFVFLGLYHLVTFNMMIFFFLSVDEFNDPEIVMFMSKFYLVVFIGVTFVLSFLSLFIKDVFQIENDQKVVRSYHIDLPKQRFIQAKGRILETFYYPKLTFIYTVFTITSLILQQYTLTGYLLINYIQCMLIMKLCSLVVAKTANNLNSNNQVLHTIQFILVVGFIAIFRKFIFSPIDKYFLFQLLSIGMIIVLYGYNYFFFKDFEKFKTDKGGV